MFRRVLTTVDMTEACPFVVDESIAFAARIEAKLMLLHVIESKEALHLPYAYYPVMDGYSEFSKHAVEDYEKRIQEHRDLCQTKLDTYQKQAQEMGVEAETKLVTGEAGHSICDVVKEWDGDLILLGHCGLRGLKEIVLGSVSNFVMHHSPCSVLVLRGLLTPDSGESETSMPKELIQQR